MKCKAVQFGVILITAVEFIVVHYICIVINMDRLCTSLGTKLDIQYNIIKKWSYRRWGVCWCSTVHWGVVLLHAVEYSVVQYSGVEYSAVIYSVVG